MTFSVLAGLLSRLTIFCAFVLVAGFVIMLAQPFAFPELFTAPVPQGAVGVVAAPGAVAMSRMTSLLTLIPALIALWHAARLLKGFAGGAILTDENARHIRWIGVAIAARALLLVPAETLSTLLLTLNNAPGQRVLSIGLSSNHLEMLIYGGLIWLIGAAMRTAAIAAAENAEFV